MALNGINSGTTPSSADILSNKTIDGDENTVLDLKASSFKAGEIVNDLGPAQPDYVKPAAAKAVQDLLSTKADQTALDTHTGDTGNPHSVTPAQIGLGSVEDTADIDKPISTATQAALDLKETIAGAKKQAIKMAIALGG